LDKTEGFSLQKYSEELKLAAIHTYRAGQLGWKAAAKVHNVEPSSLRKWVAAYEVHGIDGIRRKNIRQYSEAFKLEVLQRMRDEALSYRQVAALFNIRRFDVIGAWENAYERDGAAGLSSRRGGRSKQLTNGPAPKSEVTSQSDDKLTREQLLAEVNSLRMENAYLKKLDALVQSQRKSAPGKGRKS
jgi:transposase